MTSYCGWLTSSGGRGPLGRGGIAFGVSAAEDGRGGQGSATVFGRAATVSACGCVFFGRPTGRTDANSVTRCRHSPHCFRWRLIDVATDSSSLPDPYATRVSSGGCSETEDSMLRSQWPEVSRFGFILRYRQKKGRCRKSCREKRATQSSDTARLIPPIKMA